MNAVLRVPLLLTILLSTRTIIANPGDEERRDNNNEERRDKNGMILIDLDVSGDIPDKIKVIKSRTLFHLNRYRVAPEYKTHYRIGAISDNGMRVLDENHQNLPQYSNIMERQVSLFRDRYGTNVVRVTDTFKIENSKVIKNMLEFINKPGKSFYALLVRYHIDIDLLDPGTLDKLNVHKIEGSGFTVFQLRKNMLTHAYIGVVKYGGQIVHEALSNDVIEREVTLDNSPESHAILVRSTMRDGSSSYSKYLVVEDGNGGRIVHEETKTF
ncbi:signal peptide containing protein [Theileria equi strain WA]|uniref:Signal peptide containing protein n=1 Tax=Theileria equi strain WA TaxID=1537102 RepID=L1LAK2_THEEQ|nr:signal peptide containing protein [Theileria equi strain WA]EKX72269.1 signal peptide containing protein [Theileria equi strain WA]|eukprot:XP_004831721.1 signal peptide containing protein [Theileria equi strain WA]